jgi:hypothetical protein
MEQQRVTIGRSLSDPIGGHCAAGAGTFSMMIWVLILLVIGTAINRATVSVGPPAANGTTTVMTLLG